MKRERTSGSATNKIRWIHPLETEDKQATGNKDTPGERGTMESRKLATGGSGPAQELAGQ